MAAVQQFENVIILTNGDTLAASGIIASVLVTAGAASEAEVIIKRASDNAIVATYKVLQGQSQDFKTKIRYKEDLAFEINGTGAVAYAYLEV